MMVWLNKPSGLSISVNSMRRKLFHNAHITNEVDILPGSGRATSCSYRNARWSVVPSGTDATAPFRCGDLGAMLSPKDYGAAQHTSAPWTWTSFTNCTHIRQNTQSTLLFVIKMWIIITVVNKNSWVRITCNFFYCFLNLFVHLIL